MKTRVAFAGLALAALGHVTGPAAEPAPKSRATSPAVAAQLTAAAPKFTGIDQPATPAPEIHEPDRPRNTIPRLPPLVYRRTTPTPQPNQLMTAGAQAEQIYRRFPGLRFGELGIFRNTGIGSLMLWEEHRLERMKEANDLLGLLPDAQAREMKDQVNESFIRKTDPTFLRKIGNDAGREIPGERK